MASSIAMLTSKHRGDPRKGVYGTPAWFFEPIRAEFGLEVDVCAHPENAVLPRYWTKKDNGLIQKWSPLSCWCNPPYGAITERWVRKALKEARLGATVVCLLPARTDTRWWHRYVVHANEIRFYAGRIKFEGMTSSGSFGSVLVVYRPSPPFDGPVIRWEALPGKGEER